MAFSKQCSFLLLLLLWAQLSVAQNLPIFQYKKRAPVKTTNTADASESTKALEKGHSALKAGLEIDETTLSFLQTHFGIGRISYAAKDAKARKALEEHLKNQIRFADTVPYNDEDRKDLLKILKDSLRDHQTYNDTTINRIAGRIAAIKIFNTNNQLLAKTRYPVPFFIGDIGRYDIDTLNTYLFNQTGIGAFQNITFQNYLNGSVISGELANFNFRNIPLRMALVGSFTSSGDTTADKAKEASIQKILTSGGSLSLNFSVPLFLARSRNNCLHFGIYSFTSFGLSTGVDTGQNPNFDHALFSSQVGFNTHFDLASGEDNAARIEFNFPFYYVWGTEYTYQQLSQRDYCVLRLQAGLVLAGLVNFHISGPLLSSSPGIQRVPYIVSIQFSPSEAVKAVGL